MTSKLLDYGDSTYMKLLHTFDIDAKLMPFSREESFVLGVEWG